MICSDQAWNNFVMLSEPEHHEWGSPRRAAAIASLFNAISGNGGLVHFLDFSHHLDAEEVLAALGGIGAGKAQRQLEHVIERMGCALPVMDEKEREDIISRCCPEDLEAYEDCLTEVAERELLAAMEAHVAAHEAYYAGLG